MSNHCSCCGIDIPDGQSTCSMCYGDIDHGSDGYYRRWAEEQEQARIEKEQYEQEQYEQEMLELQKKELEPEYLKSRISELEKENDRLKNAQHEHFEQIVTDLEMKNRELVAENEELKCILEKQKNILNNGYSEIDKEHQKELQELKSRLDKAVILLREFYADDWDASNIDVYARTEQFLKSLK